MKKDEKLGSFRLKKIWKFHFIFEIISTPQKMEYYVIVILFSKLDFEQQNCRC